MKCKLHYGLCTLYHTNRKCSNRDLRTKAFKATDTESGKNHFILRLSQNYKYTIQIEKLFWLLIWSRRRYLNKLLFQSRRSCLDWRFSVSESTKLHKFVGVPVHAQMSELAIDRVPTQLPDLTYAPVSAQLLKFNWQLFWSRCRLPLGCSGICSCYNIGATLSRSIFNWSLTGPNGTFLSNLSVD